MFGVVPVSPSSLLHLPSSSHRPRATRRRFPRQIAGSDGVVVPMESGSGFSFDGLDDLLNIIATVRNRVQQELAILEVLLTKF